MKIKVVIHKADEGGYWAEVPSMPGVMTQGESLQELISNLYEAVEGALSIDDDSIALQEGDEIMEIAV